VGAARGAERIFPVDKRTLLHRLDEAGLIETTREGTHRRREVNAWINGRTRRVIKMRREALEPAVSTSQDREEREGREGVYRSAESNGGAPFRSTRMIVGTGKDFPVFPAMERRGRRTRNSGRWWSGARSGRGGRSAICRP
jgi:hypothetical protein